MSREQEKTIFERFIDFVIERLAAFPDLHVYHYAPYEPAALKHLTGRYGTRGDEIDQMLRAHLFVDLYSVVKNGIRASVESYSIKRLEPLYNYARVIELANANVALSRLQAALELNELDRITKDKLLLFISRQPTEVLDERIIIFDLVYNILWRCEPIYRNLVEELAVNLWFLEITFCDSSVFIDIKETKLPRLLIASVVLSGSHSLYRHRFTASHGFSASSLLSPTKSVSIPPL